MVDEIALADVCICPLPDRLEWNVSSPLKVFEYMACAKPMILTPIPAHKDVLGETNFVVWTFGFEPSDFHRAILSAFELRTRLDIDAKNATCIVRGHFEWSAQANALDQYLASGLEGFRRVGASAKHSRAGTVL